MDKRYKIEFDKAFLCDEPEYYIRSGDFPGEYDGERAKEILAECNRDGVAIYRAVRVN